MMKKIYAMMLMAVLIVVGLSAANAQTPTEKAVKPLNNFDRKTESKNLLSAKLPGEVSEVSKDTFCLGGDLELAKTLLRSADKDTTYYADALKYIGYLLEHLDGQAEAAQVRELKQMIASRKGATRDYLAALDKVEKSLQTRLASEQFWYLNVGKNAIEIQIATILNDGAAMKTELANLKALIQKAPRNVPQDVLQPLNELTKYNPEMLDKERMLVISKCDMLDDELKEELKVELDKEFKNIPYMFISSVAQQGLTELKDKLWSMLNP